MAAAAELQFAHKLASNEKRCRDRALSKLRRYLSVRSQPPSVGFTREELLKIWKGIFYCMWMQDKPLLQEQLAKNIAQLVHAFQNLDAKFLFMETFCQTMNREWNGIDRLRLDKFYTLIRQVLRQFLQEVRSSGWEDSLVSRFLDCLTAEVLNPPSNSAPSGVRYHFIDIYLEELATVGAQELSAEQNLKFIDPFCCIAAKTKDRVLLHSITHGIFELIVDQAPFAVEDLMKELERNEGADDSSEDQGSDSDLDKSMLVKSATKHINGEREEMAKSECSDTMGTKFPLDCGEDEENLDMLSDEDVGPVLQFDYTAIAGRLFELASKSKTAAVNRKRLYKLVKKFKDLAEGIFPHDALSAELSTDEDDEEDFEQRKRKKRKAATEERQRKKARKGELPVEAVNSSQPRKERAESSAPKQPAGAQRKKKKQRAARRVGDGAGGAAEVEAGGEGMEQGPETLTTATTTTTTTTTPPPPTMARAIEVEGVRQPAGVSGDQDSVRVETQTLIVKRRLKKKKKKKAKAKPAPLNGTVLAGVWQLGSQAPSPRQTGPQARLHRKRRMSSLLLSAGPGKRRAQPLNARTAKRLKLQRHRVATTGTPPPNDFVMFQKVVTPRSMFLRRAQGASPSSQPGHKVEVSSSSSKKVRFGLKNNTMAEFKRTDRSLLVSPGGPSRVAFDPQQKPRCGVLKALASPSPQDSPHRARPTVSQYM